MRRGSAEKVVEWFDVDASDLPVFGSSFNIAPQSSQPVVTLDSETDRRRLAIMRWGLVPFWSKDSKIGQSTINAKGETVTTSPAFRDAFRRRRCLVPADGFYEWMKIDAKTKQPHAIALKDDSLYAFAGIWDRWTDTATGERLDTFSIITTEPNELTARIHNRMPVILARRDYSRWLMPADPGQLPVDLLRPFDADLMKEWTVDPRVGNVRNDDPTLCDLYLPLRLF